MPYVTQWVEADLFLEHQGVRVYHTYKEQEYEDPNEFWFTVDEDNTREESHFDVRMLPTYTAPPPHENYLEWKIPHEAAARDAIRAAIEQNLLTGQTIEDE